MSAPPAISITGSVCGLCRQFIADLFGFGFDTQDSYPARWEPPSAPGSMTWGDGFRHHETPGDLAASAATCEVCHVLHRDLAPLAAADAGNTLCEGWLGLYPFWTQGKYGGNPHRGHFRAGFRGSLAAVPRGSNIIASDPLYSFRICLRENVVAAAPGGDAGGEKEEGKVGYRDYYRRFNAIPADLRLPDVARMVAAWRRECREAHEDCATGAVEHELPTRVIDVGADETARLRLYETGGERAPYVALSHCWGGPIPAITTEANRAARTEALNLEDLPRNFRDAVRVTRALGIRYLWIDSLCIVQDSRADWLREAGRMASVYAGATVVVSALDSPASTAGFLPLPRRQDRAPVAVLNDTYAVQKVFPQLFWYLRGCPLVGRGWCMQERLLAPAVLHFGREQLFWECRAGFRCEDGFEHSGRSQHDTTAKFIAIRGRIGTAVARGEELQWRDWYELLEEYTLRKLTVPSDKLPALAGAAALFKSTKPAGMATYVSGLWKEDMKPGLLWAAHYEHLPGQKVWGPSGKISNLTRPPEKDEERAPSWSWASVDGQVDFWMLRMGTQDGLEVLDVTMSAGEDELAEAHPRGTIKLRGAVAQMFYRAQPNVSDLGVLTFGRDDSLEDRSGTLHGCLMDVDRSTARFCWVIIAAQSSGSWLLLVLDEREDESSYRRIGLCIAHGVAVDSRRFKMRYILVS